MTESTEASSTNRQLRIARTSWIATIVAIGGNIFTAPVVRGTGSPVVGMLVGAFWSLFMLYGVVVGIYAIVRGFSPQHRKCLKHGIIGAVINIFLIVSAVVTIQTAKEIARQRAEQQGRGYSPPAARSDQPTP
jgi:hypothetical protein